MCVVLYKSLTSLPVDPISRATCIYMYIQLLELNLNLNLMDIRELMHYREHDTLVHSYYEVIFYQIRVMCVICVFEQCLST